MTTSLTPVVICGDARHIPLADGSVHCVVTSPPYWGLRKYGGDPGMIGMEETFDEHLGNLVLVFREVRRVLRDDGTLWLNYGDAYSGGWRTAYPPDDLDGHPRPGREHKNRSVWPMGLKPKDLMMMPARVAMALQADGWWIRSEIIWHKPNPMPESCTDRPTSSHEKVFLLTKKPRYFYDADAVRQPATGGTHSRGTNHRYERDKGDKSPSRPFSGPSEKPGANLRNVWKIPTHSFPGAHFATFPPALAKRCILAGTSAAGVCAGCGAPWVRQVEIVPYEKQANGAIGNREDGTYKYNPSVVKRTQTLGWLPSCTCDAGRVPATVFDPFGGSGTVGIVAEELGRRSVITEISPEYCRMARERIDKQQPSLSFLEDVR